MANVAHSTLTGANLHEPKGIAAADANLVYVSDGEGTGDWVTVPREAIDSDALSPIAFIAKRTAASSSSLVFTSSEITGYSSYFFVFNRVRPATSGASFRLLMSSNNGSSYFTTNYFSSVYGFNGGAAVLNSSSVVGLLSANAGTDTGSGPNSAVGISGQINLFPTGYASYQGGLIYYTGVGSNAVSISAGGNQLSTDTVNNVSFQFGSGNVSAGTISLYGVRDS